MVATPRQVLRRLRQSIADWPTGRTDGTLAVLWSLAAWVFVIAAVVLTVLLVGLSLGLVDADVAADLVERDGSVSLLGLAGVFLMSCLLLTYRLGYWRGQRALRRRTAWVPTQRPFLQPDPEATRSDRAAGGLWLYLLLLALALLLGL